MKQPAEKELDALVPLPLIHAIHDGLRSYEGTQLEPRAPAGGGGLQFVSKLANQPVAMELALTGERIDARTATEYGLVNLEEERRYDRRIYERLRDTEDHREGRRAFAKDDYEPTFSGR